MPHGARGGSYPGERRGGRQKGSLNKYTRGHAWREAHSQSLTIGRTTRTLQGYSTLDGRLELLRWAIETCVQPEHRKAIGTAIDQYIEAREKAASKKHLNGRNVVKAPPPLQPPMPALLDPGLPLLMDWGPISFPDFSAELDPEIVRIAKRRGNESVDSIVKRLTAELERRGRIGPSP